MTGRKKSYLAASVLLPVLWLGGCASNEELFAEYDAYCQGEVCAVEEPQVIYQEVEVPATTLTWEPAVYFGYDRDTLDPAEQDRLDRNLEVLLSDSSLKINLQAFTDSVASYRYNVALAERRRQAVVDYLVDGGLPAERIISSSGGELLPVLPSDSVQDRVINRRVEMMLLDQSGRPVSFGMALTEEGGDFVPPYPAEKVEE